MSLIGGNDEYTKLLIHSDTTDGSTTFVDSSSSGHTVTANGDVHHETDQQKFGKTGVFCDGVGDFLNIPTSPDWDFGTNPWAVDFWFYSSVTTDDSNDGLFSLKKEAVSAALLQITYNSGKVSFRVASTIDGRFDVVVSHSTWHHIAVTSDGINARCFVDGVQVGSVDVSVVSFSDGLGGMWIGNYYDGNYPLQGYLDEIRISKGIARWTADFTPPTAPYSLPFNPDKKITLTIPAGSSELTDFPALVNLSNSSGLTGFDCSAVFTELGLNSKKIAVEIGDTGIQTPVEIENWEADNAQLHVKIPTVSATVPTTLNLYYDSTQPDNTAYVGDTGDAPAQAVYKSSIKFLSHQAQDPSGTAPQILDSTSFAKHGTSYGTMASGDLIDGLSGKAIEYDGVDDYTNHGYDAAHDITDVLTIRAVIKPSVTIDSIFATTVGIANRQNDPTDTEDSFALFINGSGLLQFGSQGGNLQSTKASWTLGDTFVIAATYNSTGFVGNLFVNGIKEVLTSDALDAMSGSTNNLAIGKQEDIAAFFPGMIDEVMIVNEVLSDDWIATDNLSLRDELITFSAIAEGPTAIFAYTTMPYGNAIAANIAMLDMLYSITSDISSHTDMPYGIQLGMATAMYYGDAPALLKIVNQYYGDAPVLMKAMEMKYGDMLLLQKSMDMPYHILKPLQAIMNARYGINGEVLQSIMDHNYSISEYNLICKKFDMPYLLQSDQMVQTVSTSLTIGGNSVAFNHLSIECDHRNFVITGEAHLADLGQFLLIEKGDTVEAVCNETTYHLLISARPKRSRPGGPVTLFIVEFASPALTLTTPWTRPIQQNYAPAPAETIINDLLGSHGPVEYLTTTFPVLPDTLYANDEDARTVIRKLTQSVGAVMQSNLDGSLRIEPEYPKGWNTDAPISYFMTDERNFISQDETPISNSGENKFQVSNTSSSDERTWPEQRTISDTEVEVLGFQVPWGCKEVYGLTHSGGEWVNTPEYMGAVEETYPAVADPAERIEFKAGFASASRPIMGNLQINWLRQSLGAITYAEDGKLEAELKTGSTEGYGLCEIRYTTRFHLWRVRDAVSEDVQYILWVQK